jgi:hypothetical protein
MVTTKNSAMYVDKFTSLDDIKGKDQSNDWLVLRTIMKNGGRFSVFDASNDTMAHTLTRICRSDWVKIRDESEYPWTILDLTDAGHAAFTLQERQP